MPARHPVMPANTAIADFADFQHTEMPANTAIAEFADFADFFRADDRANAGTAPIHRRHLWSSGYDVGPTR